jgi:hypothetical protein
MWSSPPVPLSTMWRGGTKDEDVRRGSVAAPRASARGQCVVCGCVDSPRAACARRSARIRQSSTNAAIARTRAAAKTGIQWSRTSIVAKTLLLCFNHDAESDAKQSATDHQGERERAEASFLEERIQRSEDDDKNTDVSNRFTEQVLCFALVDHDRVAVRERSRISGRAVAAG